MRKDTCPVPRCRNTVSPGNPICTQCWDKTPVPLRDSYWHGYHVGRQSEARQHAFDRLLRFHSNLAGVTIP